MIPRRTPATANRFARAWLLAMRDELGDPTANLLMTRAGQDTVFDPATGDDLPADTLDRAYDFARLAAANHALDGVYGAHAGRGMALQIGRAWFTRMRTSASLAPLPDDFRTRAPEDRVRAALQSLAQAFTQWSDQATTFEEGARAFRLLIDPSPFAWGERAERSICQPMTGLLQAAASWASAGVTYVVRETHCRAVDGGACIFEITKQASPSEGVVS